MLQKVTNRPDAETVGWRAFYDLGRIFDSKTWEWKDLPENGVQVIVFYDRVRPYRAARLGDDYFWFFPETGMFDSCTDAEVQADPMRIPPKAIDRGLVKNGKELPEATYNAIMLNALNTSGDHTYWKSPENEAGRIDKHG